MPILLPYFTRFDFLKGAGLEILPFDCRRKEFLAVPTPAVEFGPRGLKTVREAMIKKGWCRGYVNQSTNRIKRMFKWATAEEIIPGSVSQALWAVSGLKKGRCEAKEPDPVRPVSQEHIDAIQPYVSRQIWAMIQMQLLTAARPGEILKMRPCDIDPTGNLPILHCWQTIGCNNQAGTLL